MQIHTLFNPLRANPSKMVKHTQTIRWFDHFVGLTLKGLKNSIFKVCQTTKYASDFVTE